MKPKIRTLALAAVLGGLPFVSDAQLVVYEDNYNDRTPGTGFPAWNWTGGACTHDATFQDIGNGNIVVDHTGIINNTGGSPVNTRFGSKWDITLTNNTSQNPEDYTISFDLRSLSGNWDPLQLQLFVLTKQGPDQGRGIDIFISQAEGWRRVEFKLSELNLGWWQGTTWNLANPNWSIEIGGPPWPGWAVQPGEAWTQVWQMDNLKITMATDVPPPPPPTVNLIKARPGLRIFAQNAQAIWNMEGFGTVDDQQSWVGATPSAPRKYSITFTSFDTVDGFVFQSQFVPVNYMNTPPHVPWVVWSGSNALVWTITKQAAGFTTRIDWKTNQPQSGTVGVVNPLLLQTTSTNGVGTWTLSFTSDTEGTVTAPDGTSGAFSLPPEMAEQFANPLHIFFGICPWSVAGYGQYVDISRITITNVAGVNVDVDFTKEDVFDTGLWNTGFSVDQGSVIQVSTNTPFWLTWTVPDWGYGIATKANLADLSTPWRSPAYWNGITPEARLMGTTLKWALIPKACLPTVDGNPGSPPSPTGFFRLMNPPPSQ